MSTVAAQVGESSRAFASVFANRALRQVNLALAASVIGDWAYNVAVSVWAYQHGGATAVGVYAVARYALMALLGPLVATLADRYPRQAVMIGSDLARAVVVVGGAVVMWLDGPVAAIYGIGLLTSILGLAFRPAQSALLPELARDPRELTSANVVASTVESVGFFLGPAIGAVLLALADVELVYLANAATFALSAAFISGVRAPAAPASATEQDTEPIETTRGFVTEAIAGFQTIMRIRELRLIAALMAAQTVVAGAELVFEVSIALDMLDMGESGVGLLSAVLGVGGLVGGFTALVLAARGRIATDFGIGVLLWAAPLLLIAVVPSLPAALVAMVVIGIANPLVDINAFTIVQRLAPAEVMGRVFGALESILFVGLGIGALVTPLLINTVGLRVALAIVGAVVAVLAVTALGALARIDRTVLAPAGLDLLRTVPTLAALPPPVIERLAQVLVPLTLAPGEHVVRQGEHGDHFWIVERGTAIVSIAGDDIRELGPGGSFGEIALLRDVPRTASVRAGAGGLVVAGLDRVDFLGAVTGHGEAREVAEATADRWLAVA